MISPGADFGAGFLFSLLRNSRFSRMMKEARRKAASVLDWSNYRNLSYLHLKLWQRQLLIGLLVALSGQLYLSVWAEGFRVSAAVILYPALLVTLMRDSHRPTTGLVTGLCVLLIRMVIDLFQGTGLLHALVLEYPGGVFYLCYDALLCLLIRDRRSVSPLRLCAVFWICDLASNAINLLLSSHMHPQSGAFPPALSLAGLALARSFTACAILWVSKSYRQLLIREEHERRYRRLVLMTASLKTELYFLKKDAEDIEGVMSNAYRLYERLEGQSDPELASLALSIARDVHEVKKDNLRIIRGLEENVADAYDHQDMSLQDLLNILEISTRQFLGKQRADIRLECHCQSNLSVREHYRLLSILKNLVTNAVEAIQSGTGRGAVRVETRTEGEDFLLLVSDDGPGIPPRAIKMLFQVGYSTKFNADTGDMNRGVGLPAVQYIVEELGGSIQVDSQLNQGTVFQVRFPLAAITGGDKA